MPYAPSFILGNMAVGLEIHVAKLKYISPLWIQFPQPDPAIFLVSGASFNLPDMA